jgi:hypothetical protein
MQMHPKIAEGVAQYHATKPVDDIDMISAVRDIMLANGLAPAINNFNNHRFIKEAENKPSVVQRVLLNRYWSMQFMSCSIDASNQRFMLLPDGTITNWLQIFSDNLIPFILDQHLPIGIE